MLPIPLLLPFVGILCLRGFGDLGASVSTTCSASLRSAEVRGADPKLLPGVVLEGEPHLQVLDMLKTSCKWLCSSPRTL